MKQPWISLLLVTAAILSAEAYVKTFYNCAEPGTLSFIFTGPLNTAAMPGILQSLKARNLYGTFFSIWAMPDPQTKALAQQLLDAGHGLGIQLYLGSDNQTDLAGILANIRNQASVLQSVVGTFPRFYYPTQPLQVPLRNYVNANSNFTEINPTIPHEDLGVCSDGVALNRSTTERIQSYLGPLWLTHFPNSTYIVGASTSCEPGILIDFLNRAAPNRFVKLPQCVQHTYGFLTTPEYYGSGAPQIPAPSPSETIVGPVVDPVVDDASVEVLAEEPVDVYIEGSPEQTLFDDETTGVAYEPTIANELPELDPEVVLDPVNVEEIDPTAATVITNDFVDDTVYPIEITDEFVNDGVDPAYTTAIADDFVDDAIYPADDLVEDAAGPIDATDIPADSVDDAVYPGYDFVEDAESHIDATGIPDGFVDDAIYPGDDFAQDAAGPTDATGIPDDFLNDAVYPGEDFVDDAEGHIDTTGIPDDFLDDAFHPGDDLVEDAVGPTDATGIPDDFLDDAVYPGDDFVYDDAGPIDATGIQDDLFDYIEQEPISPPAGSDIHGVSDEIPVEDSPDDSVWENDGFLVNEDAETIVDRPASDSVGSGSTCRVETVSVTIPAETVYATITVTITARQAATWETATASANASSSSHVSQAGARDAAAQSSSPPTHCGIAMTALFVMMVFMA